MRIGLTELRSLRGMLGDLEAEILAYMARAAEEAAEDEGCECSISGPGHVIPIACRIHGTPCKYCGGLKSCASDCGGGLTGG